VLRNKINLRRFDELAKIKNQLEDFIHTHDEFIMDWNIAMSSGETSSLERMTEDYYVAFFKGPHDKPMIFNKQEAISGMRQSVKHFSGASKRFQNRIVRLKDNENAVVFYEQVIEKNEKVLARLFTIENWKLINGKWMIVRETEEAVH
jgi:hypothetical protein